MEIRVESPDDFAAIGEVVEAAFGKQDEVRLVDAVRASDGYVPELSLVAVDGAEIVGHVMLSYVGLDGSDRRLLELAPLAVAPARQHEGIGGALTRDALARADAAGEPLVLVLGHAEYYPRFGFRPSTELGLEPPDERLRPVFFAAPLGAYEKTISGRIVFPPAFEA
ncbi:MAG TPA: N-acetyltransferase [Gaiellaceae bacterium]